jgi:hypothetical protein
MLFSIIISPETSVLNTWTSVDRFQKTRSDLVSFFVVQASTDDYNKCLQAMMDARAVWQAVRIISSLLVILFGFLLFSQEESVVQRGFLLPLSLSPRQSWTSENPSKI